MRAILPPVLGSDVDLPAGFDDARIDELLRDALAGDDFDRDRHGSDGLGDGRRGGRVGGRLGLLAGGRDKEGEETIRTMRLIFLNMMTLRFHFFGIIDPSPVPTDFSISARATA